MDQEIFSEQDWDEYARCYNALLQLNPYQELIADVLSSVLPREDDIILDAGCGTGNLLHALRNKAQGAQLYGVDLSKSMLAFAKRACSQDRVDLLHASLDQRLPFSDGMFTKITSVNVLYAVPRPEETLRELYRVLQRGGMLVIESPKQGYDNGLVLKAHCNSTLPDSYWTKAHSSPERERELVHAAITDPLLAEQMLKIASHNRKIAQTSVFHFYQEAEFRELLNAAGFTLHDLVPAYAQQGLLAVASKGEKDEKR